MAPGGYKIWNKEGVSDAGDLSCKLRPAGSSINPLYDLMDEVEARQVGTLMGDKNDLNNWHFSGKYPKGFFDNVQEMSKPGDSYYGIRNNTTQLSTASSAVVLSEMKDNVLSGSAFQVLKLDPKATVGDAINYYNSFQKAHGSSRQILTGKSLENR